MSRLPTRGLTAALIGSLSSIAWGNPLTLTVQDTTLSVEIADTPDERAQGLMKRTSLEPNAGMLFVYPDEGRRSFWMKDTLIPLTVAFVNQSGAIVDLKQMQPLNLTPVPSSTAAMYAIEMEQGWFAQHNIGIGAQLHGLPGPSQR